MGSCLVTGATGYIGGRLAPRLLAAGYQVRCLSRSPHRLDAVPWARDAEIVRGDLLEPDTLPAALDGVEVAYYLAHSLGAPSFADTDRRAATNFAAAARAAGVRRIVYLGGPVPHQERSSPHLRSRAEVGRILSDAGVPAVLLRAAVVIGSGSASFEMLRYLTERLPVMVAPRWVGTRTQPIAIRDVLRYLVGWAEVPREVHRAFDIGGPDVLTYREMMRRYARIAGLPRRLVVPVRALTPWLSAYWVGLVTPVPNAIARPLVESLVHEAVAGEHDIARYVPDPPTGLIHFDTAVRLALRKVASADVETSWATSTWTGAPADPIPTDPPWAGGSSYVDTRRREVGAPAEVLWSVVQRLGGDPAWYASMLPWTARGWFDRLAGGIGVGVRGPQRDPRLLRAGDALDAWRVEEIDPPRLLRLRAQLLLPGRAWLEMRVLPDGARSRYEQRAVFLPKGLAGHLYWKGVSPSHPLVFGGMANTIARTAERLARHHAGS